MQALASYQTRQPVTDRGSNEADVYVNSPSPDDPEMLLARQKKQQEMMAQKAGRASTEMATDKGPAYSRTTLG